MRTCSVFMLSPVYQNLVVGNTVVWSFASAEAFFRKKELSAKFLGSFVQYGSDDWKRDFIHITTKRVKGYTRYFSHELVGVLREDL